VELLGADDAGLPGVQCRVLHAPVSIMLRLRGGGQDAGQEGAEDGEGLAGKSWKDMINSETRIPFEIMGSPLLDDDEIERIERSRRQERGGALEPSVEELRTAGRGLFSQPRVETGPNGTYGRPDLTGRRWRSLKSTGEKKTPYARVELRYRVNKTQAESDPTLRILNAADQDKVYANEVQEEYPDDGTLDGFLMWYDQNADKLKDEFKEFFPPPNLTLAPWSMDQPSGTSPQMQVTGLRA
jgi:hypothetical protein